MIDEMNGVLTFDLSKIDNPQLNAIANDVIFLRHGSTILIVSKADEQLLCQFNSFDNTVFICDPRGYEIANLFGSKRFIVGHARKALSNKAILNSNAIHFPRDFRFPLAYRSVSLPKSLTIVSEPDDYSELSDQLIRLSGFTPEKIEEYKKNGDIFCRFNPVNQLDKYGCFTCAIFIADTQQGNRLVGALIADVILTDEDCIDIYFRDEVVEQPCTLEYLFEAGRMVINQKLLTINANYQPSHAFAFIRAAQGKESKYIEEGCSSTDTGIYVIHGPRTKLAETIDSYVKEVTAQPTSTRKTILEQYHRSVNGNKLTEANERASTDKQERMFNFFS